MIRQTALGIATTVAMLGSATAADIRSAPAMAAPVSWSGFFVGGNMGVVGNDDKLTYGNEFTGTNFTQRCFMPDSCGRSNSVVGGGQIGYNLQSGAIVYGVVADAAAMRLRNQSSVTFGNAPSAGAPFGSVTTDTAHLRSEQTGFYTVRGRVGYSFDSLLFYATGGLAISEISARTSEILAPGTFGTCTTFPAACRSASASKTITGYAVGGGVEWALTENWSVGAEYLYADLGRKRFSFAQTTPSVRFPTSTTSVKSENHVGRLTLNYRFNWW